MASEWRTWGLLGPLLGAAAVNVHLSQGWGSAFFTLPSIAAFYAGVEWLRKRWNIRASANDRSKAAMGNRGRPQPENRSPHRRAPIMTAMSPDAPSSPTSRAVPTVLPSRGLPALDEHMSTMRETPHHLLDHPPELRTVPELIREQPHEPDLAERDLPFFASFEADPDLAEHHKKTLRPKTGR